jgi:hypothetical protein
LPLPCTQVVPPLKNRNSPHASARLRFASASPSVGIEDPNRDKVESDWRVPKVLFQERFLTEQDHFKAAFNPYVSEDDFETQLKNCCAAGSQF